MVTKEELIAALVTDKYSGFKNGDEPMLASASDARLEEFRTAAEARRTEAGNVAKAESEQRNTMARLKVAEDKVQKLEQPITDDDFIARLSPTSPIKQMIEQRAAEEASIKSSLVNALKDANVETEEQLKKKSIPELQTLAAYARVKVVDFSGRGLPVDRAAQQTTQSYAPPKPWSEALAKQNQKAS